MENSDTFGTANGSTFKIQQNIPDTSYNLPPHQVGLFDCFLNCVISVFFSGIPLSGLHRIIPQIATKNHRFGELYHHNPPKQAFCRAIWGIMRIYLLPLQRENMCSSRLLNCTKMLIGRKKEQNALLRAFESSEAQFVAVYGRRRVGKTYLVRQTFKNRLTFSCSGQARGKTSDQLFGWMSSLNDAGMKELKRPATWLEAFELLKELIRQSTAAKKVIFLDELPWFDTPRSGFVNALEFFWNGWASGRDDVLLIVCGSATSWIVSKLLRNHGGLHNRVTLRIHLEPFSLAECEQYVSQRGFALSRYDILETYMALGGIPFYWSMLDPGLSVAQNIDQLFFAPSRALHTEFGELYHSLFKQADHYIAIVRALGEHLPGLTRQQLVKASEIASSGTLTSSLSALEQCGFIKVLPALDNKKDSVFQLIDNFSLFYFKFLAKAEANDEHFWSHSYLSPLRRAWVGLAFERVCFQHIPQIKQALGIAGVATHVCSWRIGPSPDGEAGAQIDMLISRADNMINICEMKFSSQPYVVTHDDIVALHHKAARLSSTKAQGKSLNLTLITPYGLAQTGHWSEIHNVITTDDLFAP